MRIANFHHFGGVHGESAAIKNLLSFTGVVHPHTGTPLSEALCFGIAGGLGIGYSFCPSIPRHQLGSGITIVGRHKSYVTDASWYQGCFDRLGIPTRRTETTGAARAYRNLVAELEEGRPAVVWCGRALLPYLHEPVELGSYFMHTFLVHEIDESAGIAHGSECAPTEVTLSLETLEHARQGVCSHRNRTLSIAPQRALSLATLRSAVHAGLQACLHELTQPKMKTFSLHGLETWAKMIENNTAKDGWGRVFGTTLLSCALRDVYDSIVTRETGGDLFRGLFASFLDEAAILLDRPALADLARDYRRLGARWRSLAESALPASCPPLHALRDLLDTRAELFVTQGQQADAAIAETAGKLRALDQNLRQHWPLDRDDTATLLGGLREQILALYQDETAAVERFRSALA